MSLRPAAFALAAALLALPAVAAADGLPSPPAGKAACTVEMVHALSDGDGSMDPQLSSLREDLKRPPFTAWKTFKLLDRKSAELVEGKSASFPTPDGNSVSITFAGRATGAGGKHRIKLALDLPGSKSSSKTQLTLDDGGHVLVAGLKHQGGILIHAVTCKTVP